MSTDATPAVPYLDEHELTILRAARSICDKAASRIFDQTWTMGDAQYQLALRRNRVRGVLDAASNAIGFAIVVMEVDADRDAEEGERAISVANLTARRMAEGEASEA